MSRRYTWADIGHIQITGDAMIERAEKILAERAAWRAALGIPQGFEIPDRMKLATR